jgi:predicted DCC family thiol-disulfide oxidoreductase YuxK
MPSASAASSSAARSRPLSAWDRYWFGEASLVRLGAFRIVMMSLAMLAAYQDRVIIFQFAGEPGAAYFAKTWRPIYAFQVLGVKPMDATTAHAVYVVLLASIALGLLGLWTRVSCAIAAVLTFLWIGTDYSYGKPHHDCVTLVLGLLALPLGPVGARLSIDSLIARIRRARQGEDPISAPIEAPWAALPWRFTQITAAIGYGFAGASKIAIGGFTWLNGYTLQGTMLEYNAPWTAFLAHSVLLCSLMSIGVVIIQGTFPLVFFSRRLRWFYVPGAILFHLVSWKTLDTGLFLTLWMTLASFIELDRVPAFVHARATSGPGWLRAAWIAVITASAAIVVSLYFNTLPSWTPLAIVPLVAAAVLACLRDAELDVIYDGDCGVCRTTIAWLAALNWSRRLRFLDLAEWERVAALHPSLDRDACLRDMPVVTRSGRVFKGYDAYRAVALRLPLAVWIAPLMALPVVSHVGRRVYRQVADNRWRTSCSIAPRRTPAASGTAASATSSAAARAASEADTR